jgi:hypothetical protein
MFDDAPPWLKKSWGHYLRQSKHWKDKDLHLERILIFLGIEPPPGEAEKYAKALAQKLAPLGRPRKDTRPQGEQLELNLNCPPGDLDHSFGDIT